MQAWLEDPRAGSGAFRTACERRSRPAHIPKTRGRPTRRVDVAAANLPFMSYEQMFAAAPPALIQVSALRPPRAANDTSAALHLRRPGLTSWYHFAFTTSLPAPVTFYRSDTLPQPVLRQQQQHQGQAPTKQLNTNSNR